MSYRNRVERRIDEYDLDDLGDLKFKHQTGEMTIKEIKTKINIVIVESAMIEAGEDPRPGAAKYSYQYLKDDQNPTSRQETINRLEEIGIDPVRLERDLIRRDHIENYLGVDPDPPK